MLQRLCSQPVVHAVGQVAMWFGNLELWLEGAIIQLLTGIARDASGRRELEQMAQAVAVEMSFDRKIHAFYSMYKIKFPAEAENEDLKTLVNELFAVQDERNSILHSAWSYDENGELTGRLNSSAKAKRLRGLRRRLQSAEAEEISAVARHIADVGQRFGYFCKEHIQDRA
jgi:hypothetical protein